MANLHELGVLEDLTGPEGTSPQVISLLRCVITGYPPRVANWPAKLPEPVAFAAYEFITGPLLDNPHRVCVSHRI